LDVCEADVPPNGALCRFRKTLQADHPNTRLVIFVGEKYLISRFLNILFRIYGRFFPASRIQFVNSLEEAELLISHRGDSLQIAPDS
jgi:hypothetical protein